MTKIKTIRDVNVLGKYVFVRVDFNVPLDDGQVADSTRILATLPTIQYLIKEGARVVLASHLGRPDGEKNTQYSLKPVAFELAKLLDQPVLFLDDCIGSSVEASVRGLENGGVALLENLRFYKQETDNDPTFSKALAKLADIYVNDAFGTAHRAHASTHGITKHTKINLAGFLMEKELTYLGEKIMHPKRPFCVILGGAKVSDKIKLIDKLIDSANTMIIGGAMAYTFKLAMGGKVGKSLVELDKVKIAQAAIEKAAYKKVKLMLPVDTLVTNVFDFKNRTVGDLKVVEGDIPDNWEGVDIGPKTMELFTHTIQLAATILLNGPMGVFEIPSCAKGSDAIVKAIASNRLATSIIGGGDSVSMVNQSGLAKKVTFMSTGGGASLEFLEGHELPGVSVLDRHTFDGDSISMKSAY
jgi:phosphoglycerate kinase